MLRKMAYSSLGSRGLVEHSFTDIERLKRECLSIKGSVLARCVTVGKLWQTDIAQNGVFQVTAMRV